MQKAANNISTTNCILFANIGQNTAVKCTHEYERKMTTKTNQGTKKAAHQVVDMKKFSNELARVFVVVTDTITTRDIAEVKNRL